MNLFELPSELPAVELFEPLVAGEGVLVERIVSTGQSTPAGAWLENHEADEWVVVLQGEAELTYREGDSVTLSAGDHVLIPVGTSHRVERTSSDPPCIWLAVHADGLLLSEHD